LNSALAQVAEERVAEAFPLQHELLGLPESRHAEALREKRRGGRPPGARNKRAEEVARFVLERLGDPLVQLVAIATAPVDELMAAGLKPAEAFAEKRLAAIGVLPYLHQRKPIEVDVTGRQVVYLAIGDVAAEASPDQWVMGEAGAELDGAELDGGGNPLIPLPVPAAAQLMPDQAPPPPAAPLAPAPEAPHPPGGGDFAAVALSHAPAAVVPRHGRLFQPPRNRGPAHPGAGGGGPRIRPQGSGA
jgi:hypothetical protein